MRPSLVANTSAVAAVVPRSRSKAHARQNSKLPGAAILLSLEEMLEIERLDGTAAEHNNPEL